MNIWGYQRVVGQRLLAWNVINIVVGLILTRGTPVQQGIASQNVGWGIINIGIALIGGLAGGRRSQQADAMLPATLTKETTNLRRLLWINTGLDVLYILGGWFFSRRNRHKPVQQGMGYGIIIQGALLFVFDLLHVLPLHRPAQSSVTASSPSSTPGD
jgi:hypothetical protein